MKNTILWALVGVGAGLAAGCQTYDFEPVEPLAIAQTTQSKSVAGKQLKPNLMMLIDKSGSMNFAANPADPNCPANCGSGTPCPGNCRTRMQELKTAMQTFLTDQTSRSVAWIGMAIFPTAVVVPPNMNADSCGATSSADIKVPLAPNPDNSDLDTEIAANSAAVNAEVQQLKAGGGTPTGDSIAFLQNYTPLFDPNPKAKRQDFILLLTDGLPNCNANIPDGQDCNNAPVCKCTLVPATSCTPASFCKQGCLDSDHSVAEIAAMLKKEVKTIVIGFGADTAAGDGPNTLNAMAEAGGFPRGCKSDPDCGANAPAGECNTATGFCLTRKFYQASNAADLAAVLADIGKALDPGGICNYTLDAVPSDPKFLAVIIDGKNQPGGTPDTWNYAAGKVQFVGALCKKVTDANTTNPVKVEFRIVESF